MAMQSPIVAAALIAAAGTTFAQTPVLEARTSFGSNFNYATGSVGVTDLDLADNGNIGFTGYSFSSYDNLFWFGSVGNSGSVAATTGNSVRDTKLSATGELVWFEDGFGGFIDGFYNTSGLIDAAFGGGSSFSIGAVGQLADGTLLHTSTVSDDSVFSVSSGTVTPIFTPTIFGGTSVIPATGGFAEDGRLAFTSFVGSSFGNQISVVDTSGGISVIAQENSISGGTFDRLDNSNNISNDGNAVGFSGEIGGVEAFYVAASDGSSTIEVASTASSRFSDMAEFAPAVNDLFNVVFRADDASGVEGLFFYDNSNGSITRLISVGDTVATDLGTGTISAFGDGLAINNLNDVVFEASISGQGTGVFSFAAIPSPGAGVLLALGGLAAARRRR